MRSLALAFGQRAAVRTILMCAVLGGQIPTAANSSQHDGAGSTRRAAPNLAPKLLSTAAPRAHFRATRGQRCQMFPAAPQGSPSLAVWWATQWIASSQVSNARYGR
jgi:hypothetical protein